MRRRGLWIFLAIGLGALAQNGRVITDIGDRLEAAERAQKAGKRPSPVSFRIPERDMNAFLAEEIRKTGRPGVDGLRLAFHPENRVVADTIIDLDAVERWKPGTIPRLLRPVLRGKRTVSVDLTFQAERGQWSYRIQSAEFNGVPVPPGVMQRAIEVVAARQPEKWDLSRPLPLPYTLRRVWTETGTLRGES